MFSINDDDIKQLESDLKTFAARAFPFATRNTIHSAAVAARFIAVDIVKNKMTNRNAFTRQSIQFNPSKANQITLRVSNQAAFVGSTADYMEVQEFGDTKVKTGKHGVAIPTSEASGEGPKAFPRRRLPRRANKMTNIKLTKRRRIPKNRKQATLFKVQDAVTTGKRFVFLDLGKRQGIFRVIGGRKKFKRGWPVGAKLRMIHDLTRTSVTIPKRPWLAPTVDKAEKLIPNLYRRALEFQARRQGLFK